MTRVQPPEQDGRRARVCPRALAEARGLEEDYVCCMESLLTHGNQRLVVAPHHILVELLLPLGQVTPLLLREMDGDVIERDRDLKTHDELSWDQLEGSHRPSAAESQGNEQPRPPGLARTPLPRTGVGKP